MAFRDFDKARAFERCKHHEEGWRWDCAIFIIESDRSFPFQIDAQVSNSQTFDLTPKRIGGYG
jgi:hypothetical protein